MKINKFKVIQINNKTTKKIKLNLKIKTNKLSREIIVFHKIQIKYFKFKKLHNQIKLINKMVWS